jgi:hypothetical protein
LTTAYFKHLSILGTHKSSTQASQPLTELNEDEEGALRYIEGYLIYKYKKQGISLISLTENEEFVEDDPPASKDELDIKNWCKFIDRGGLTHSNMLFHVQYRSQDEKAFILLIIEIYIHNIS